MKKVILLLALISINHSIVFSQGCLPQGITFTTQEQINNFQINYPGCTEIEGSVTISGNNITNLSGLSVLTSIAGGLQIVNNYNLISLNGLEGISTLHYLLIANNQNLTNLSGLDDLSSTEGALGIWLNESLTSLNGLGNLNSIGGFLEIAMNDSLTILDGLENLTSIEGYLYIDFNTSLISINGLEYIDAASLDSLYVISNPLLSVCNVESICNYLATPNGTIEIYDNAPGCNSPEEVQEACETCLPDGFYFTTQEQIDSFQMNYEGCRRIGGDVTIAGETITNLDGLNVIKTILGDLWIVNNYELPDLTGLDSIEYIGGGFHFGGNTLIKNMEGLNSLKLVEGMFEISFTDSVINLVGLDSLQYINSDAVFTANDLLENFTGLISLKLINNNLSLHANNSLLSLNGLDSLTYLGNLTIVENNHLNNISAIVNVNSESLTHLHIAGNNYLSECDIQVICEYLANPGGFIEISNNAPGCNSPEEVQTECLTSIDEDSNKDKITLFPNPATSFITITTPQGQIAEEVIIYNHIGQKVLTAKPVNITIDVSKLKPGIYLVEVITRQNYFRKKLVVK